VEINDIAPLLIDDAARATVALRFSNETRRHYAGRMTHCPLPSYDDVLSFEPDNEQPVVEHRG
jgi:hypothetical protein